MPLQKMVSHKIFLTKAQGGETAFVRMRQMGIDLVRMDLRYRQMATPGGWQWEAGEGTRWHDLLEPSLIWTKEHGMRTLVNLIAYLPPPHMLETMRTAWKAYCQAARGRPRALRDRDLVLWSGWAAANDVAVDFPTPKDYTEALIDQLARGQAAGDYDIAGLCILNEPNTRWPGETNWRTMKIPKGPGGTFTYDTAGHCSDICGWVKAHIAARHAGTLGHTVNVVNLYSYRGHWRAPRWKEVAADPNVDVLGIDIYWDQLLGLFARGVPEAMREVSEEHGKPWWLVETAGADNPGWLWKRPSCQGIREDSQQCVDNGAEVLGYYRSWGDYSGRLSYGGAYNIFTEPGSDPRARSDGKGNPYWETVRDI